MISSTHKEGHSNSNATSTTNLFMLMATTSTKPQAPTWPWPPTSSSGSRRHQRSPRLPPCLKRCTSRSTRSARIRGLHTPQARFTNQLQQEPIAAKVASPTNTVMIGNPSRAELGAITPNITANTIKRSTRTSECTSTISKMHDDVSMNVVSVAAKKKYATIRSTSKSTETWTQLSSHSTSAMLQIPMPTTTPKGPQHSRGRSKHFSGPMVLKSPGSSPTREG